MKKSLLAFVSFLLLTVSLSLSISAQAPVIAAATPAKPEVQMITMRDGVKLATDVYLPEGKGPWPVILTRTPYNKTSALGAGRPTFWTAKGYAVVVQDCRGRFASEGKYMPFMDDHFDGYDTVEWIAKQVWANGKVGMTGVSAMGITSNQASITAPPHLTAMFVQLAPASAKALTTKC